MYVEWINEFILNWHVYKEVYFNLIDIFKANSSFFTKINDKSLIDDIFPQTAIRVAK